MFFTLLNCSKAQVYLKINTFISLFYNVNKSLLIILVKGLFLLLQKSQIKSDKIINYNHISTLYKYIDFKMHQIV